MFDTLREQDVKRSREELCPIVKVGSVILTHVQEATKVPYRPTTSSGRSTWDLAECTSERGTCFGTKTPQNIDDFNHGPMAILPIGN
ncbi:hypothetical protein Tco_1534992 [Tanacetum coccineum]